jgi:hypothetical protein
MRPGRIDRDERLVTPIGVTAIRSDAVFPHRLTGGR